MKILKLCKPYLLRHRYAVLVYVAMSLLATAISVLSPYLIGNFIDDLVEGGDMRVVLRFCVVFGGLSLIKILKGYVNALIYAKMYTKMSYELSMDTVRHIQALSLSYINGKDGAYLTQRIGNDSNSVMTFSINILQNTIAQAFAFIVPLVVLLSLSPFIASLMLSFLIVYMALYLLFKKSLYNVGLAMREISAKFFSRMLEQLKYVKIIKINSIQPQINSRADKVFTEYLSTVSRSQKINYLYSSMDAIVSVVAQVVLFVVGGMQILAGNFTIGMFTIFTSYFNMMLSSARYFFSLGAAYQKSLVSYDRIKEIVNQNKESHGTKLVNDINKIELRNLSLSYGAEGSFVGEFNAKFEKGKIYTICGSNGAGKTTLVGLMIGLYINEYLGTIKFNDIDIRDLDMPSIRNGLMSFAEQESMLVNDSIRFNIYFDDNIHNTALLEKSISILNMEDFVTKNTLNFVINEKNSNISGGERQKISILKALVKNAPVMIFDEPTSALDHDTTKKFMDYLHSIKYNKIIILITHDESIKACSDDILEV